MNTLFTIYQWSCARSVKKQKSDSGVIYCKAFPKQNGLFSNFMFIIISFRTSFTILQVVSFFYLYLVFSYLERWYRCIFAVGKNRRHTEIADGYIWRQNDTVVCSRISWKKLFLTFTSHYALFILCIYHCQLSLWKFNLLSLS